MSAPQLPVTMNRNLLSAPAGSASELNLVSQSFRPYSTPGPHAYLLLTSTNMAPSPAPPPPHPHKTPNSSPAEDKTRGTKRSRLSSGTILRTLTGVQNVSALTFSTFLGMHMAAPIAAGIGGASWAEKTLVCSSYFGYHRAGCKESRDHDWLD